MTTKRKMRKSTAWMDDHDDAHFSGNPAYKEPRGKKHLVGAGSKSNGRPSVTVKKGQAAKVSGSGRTGGKHVARKRAGK